MNPRQGPPDRVQAAHDLGQGRHNLERVVVGLLHLGLKLSRVLLPLPQTRRLDGQTSLQVADPGADRVQALADQLARMGELEPHRLAGLRERDLGQRDLMDLGRDTPEEDGAGHDKAPNGADDAEEGLKTVEGEGWHAL